MDIRELESFKAVVECGSILRAAEYLHMTQPPLSRMMKHLEEELGTPLFERGKKLTLLPAGKILYDHANSILAIRDDAFTEIQMKKNEEDILKIGIVSSSTNLLYSNSISEFHKEYPTVKFNITEGNTYQLVDLLESHMIDLAIVRTPFDSTKFHAKFFYHESMIILGYPTNKDSIILKELDNQPIIIYRRFKDIITLLFQENDIRLNIQALVDDAKTAILLASTGLGYSIVPESAYKAFMHLNLNHSIIDCQDLVTSLGVVTRKGEPIKEIYTNLIEYLLKVEK